MRKCEKTKHFCVVWSQHKRVKLLCCVREREDEHPHQNRLFLLTVAVIVAILHRSTLGSISNACIIDSDYIRIHKYSNACIIDTVILYYNYSSYISVC